MYTRQAADAVGATPMDRPEWVAVHPHSKEVFVTLTNNSNRGSDRAFPDGPKHPDVFGPNPRNKTPMVRLYDGLKAVVMPLPKPLSGMSLF